jgi:hypothetical protein
MLALLAGCGARTDDLFSGEVSSNSTSEHDTDDVSAPAARADAGTTKSPDAAPWIDASARLDAGTVSDAVVVVDAGTVLPDAATTPETWLLTWGGLSSDELNDIAVVGDAIYVAGSGQITNAVGPVVNYVARFDRSGGLVWAREVAGGGYSFLHPHLAIASDGSVYATAVFSGTDVDFDPSAGVDLFSGERGTPFVTKFAANGTYEWTRTWPELWGSDNDSTATVLPGGDIVVVGSCLGTPNPPDATHLDAFALRLTSAGTSVWKKTWGANHDDYPRSVVSDGTGGVVVCGSYIEYSFLPPSGDMPVSGGMDGFILRLDGSGNRTWTRTWGGLDDDGVRSCAIGADGKLAVTGVIRGTGEVHLVNGSTMPFATTSYDAFLYLLESDGAHRGFVTWGGYGYDYSERVAFVPGGDVVVAGGTVTSAFGGGGTVTGSIVRFTSSGTYASRLTWGVESTTALAVATAWDGTMVVGGTFDKTVTFPGFGPRNAPSFTDAFLWKRAFP